MINLLQETKKKVEEKNLLSRFPEFDRRSIFAAALYEKLAADAATAGAVNQFVPAEKHFEIRGQHWPAGAGR